MKRTPESEKKQMSVYLIKRKIKKKMLVVALEGGVNSNPSSREVILEGGKSETGPKHMRTYMADTKRAAAHRSPGPERGVAAYRRTPVREQIIFYPNHL